MKQFKSIFYYGLLIAILPLTLNAQNLHRGFAWQFDLSNLDPHKISSDTLIAVSKHYLATLISMDENNQPQPSLAKSWHFSDDGKFLTFVLQENAIWTDGTPINAYTVEKSLLRALSPSTSSDAKVLLSFLMPNSGDSAQTNINTLQSGSNSKIQVIDNHTIQFVVDSVNPIYLRVFSHLITAPLPIHQLNSDLTFPTNSLLASSGPYQLINSATTQLSFVINDKYFGVPPYFKEVTFEFDEYKKLIKKYLEHKLDLLEYVDPSQTDWLRTYYSKELIPRTYAGIFLLFDKDIHGKHSKSIRQALISVLNQEEMFAISKIKKEHFSPSGLVYANSRSYRSLPLSDNYQISLEAAKENMKQAGYNKNNRLKLCVAQLRIKFTELFNYIKSHWANIYVDVEFIDSVSTSISSRYLYKGGQKTCNITLVGYRVRLKHEQEIIDAFVHKDGALHGTHIAEDKKLEKKYHNLSNTKNPQQRSRQIAEIEKAILENYSALLVSKVQDISLVKPHIKNYIAATRQDIIAYSQFLTK
jgi:ABC-type transport system substrate-binding protein